MAIQAITGPAPVQEAPAAGKPVSLSNQPASLPQDKVSISAAAQAKQTSGDRHHNHGKK